MLNNSEICGRILRKCSGSIAFVTRKPQLTFGNVEYRRKRLAEEDVEDDEDEVGCQSNKCTCGVWVELTGRGSGTVG